MGNTMSDEEELRYELRNDISNFTAESVPSKKDYEAMGESLIGYFNTSSWAKKAGKAPALRPGEVNFILYAARDQSQGTKLEPNDASFRNSNFNRSNSTRILIHGWRMSQESEFFTLIKNEYFKKGNYNVIIVEWFSFDSYNDSAARVKTTGKTVAQFIDFMVSGRYVNLNALAIVGFSLGGHVAGFTGKNVSSGKVGAIVGLDPAGPLFQEKSSEHRLDKTDAQYVQVIHTNANYLGCRDPIGHADFYPNSGLFQAATKMQQFMQKQNHDADSHSRAYEYFAESINNPNFHSRQVSKFWGGIFYINCEGNKHLTGVQTYMGGDPLKRAEGLFILKTNYVSPYAKGVVEEPKQEAGCNIM